MELINAKNLNLNTGSKDILIDANLRILKGEKYGLIGPNGVGKTTLIRVLLGLIDIDKGSIYKKNDLKVGYLTQVDEFNQKHTIKDYLLSDITPIQKRLNDLEELMESDPENQDYILEYGKQWESFESLGGYNALDRGEILLNQLGLSNNLEQKMNTLSGGEKSLVSFAKCLLPDPELIILDEPGNHLDYLGLAWLEAFIKGFKGAVLIVSHNRYLLDQCCGHLIDMYKGEAKVITGNYSNYKLEKYRTGIIEQREYEASCRRKEELVKKIKHLQSISMSQYNPPPQIVAQLAGAKKKLQQEEDKIIEKPDFINPNLRLDFGNENCKSKIVLDIKELNLSFGNKILLENTSMKIYSGERVALVGANGAGKSSLIKKILNEASWDNRNLRIGPSQIVGYLSQDPVFSENSVTIEDEVRSWGPITRDMAFSIINKFLFPYCDLQKNLKVLSGGEKNRLQLAKLMYKQVNFLILDEPTNHMDIESREVIEEALKRFSGTFLVISHDRYFLDSLVDRVLEIENCKLISHIGNFTSFFNKKYKKLPRLSGELKKRGKERSHKPEEITESYLEDKIVEEERLKSELEIELKEAYLAKDSKTGRQIAIKLEKLNSRIDKLYKNYLKMS